MTQFYKIKQLHSLSFKIPQKPKLKFYPLPPMPFYYQVKDYWNLNAFIILLY